MQADVGSLTTFEAVFFTHLTVTQAGNVTFNAYSDDGWIVSMGIDALTLSQQPTYVSGAKVNVPTLGPFSGKSAIGGLNQPTAPTLNTVTVNFPAPGTYPVEPDYTECCSGQLVLDFSSFSEMYT